MTAVKAILATVGIVFAALCVALMALVIVWLTGNYGVERLIAVASFLVGVAALSLGLIAHFRPRR